MRRSAIFRVALASCSRTSGASGCLSRGPGVADGRLPNQQRSLAVLACRAAGFAFSVLGVSPQFGHVKDWPGDTFGLSASGPRRVTLSWGSAVGTTQNSEIYESVVQLP